MINFHVCPWSGSDRVTQSHRADTWSADTDKTLMEMLLVRDEENPVTGYQIKSIKHFLNFVLHKHLFY